MAHWPMALRYRLLIVGNKVEIIRNEQVVEFGTGPAMFHGEYVGTRFQEEHRGVLLACLIPVPARTPTSFLEFKQYYVL
jgi:hypothetical protein